MSRKAGFTLVELLVVMAVIAVLISIMIPALARARARAEFVVCKTKLRGCGQALNAYLEDHRGRFPDARAWVYGRVGEDPCWQTPTFAGRPSDGGVWRYPDHPPCGELVSYLGEVKEIILCPTFFKLKSQEEPWYAGTEVTVGYVMNAYLGGTWKEGWGSYKWACRGALKEAEVERAPASVLAFSDECWSPFPHSHPKHSATENALFPMWYTYVPQFWDAVGGFHLAPAEDSLQAGVANAVFLDGHVDVVSHRDEYDSINLCWPLKNCHPNEELGPPWLRPLE